MLNSRPVAPDYSAICRLGMLLPFDFGFDSFWLLSIEIESGCFSVALVYYDDDDDDDYYYYF